MKWLYLSRKAVFSFGFRTWLTILGVAVGTFALTAMGSMALHFHKMANRFETYVGGKLFLREEAGFFGAGAIPEKNLTALSKENGIRDIVPLLISRLNPHELIIFGLPKIVLGIPLEKIPLLFRDVPLVRGEWPKKPDECALGADIASGRSPQNFIYLGKRFKVSGVMSRTDGQEDEEMIVSLHALEHILGRNGLVSYGIVIPNGTVPLESLATDIKKQNTHLQVLSPRVLSENVKRSEMLWLALTVGTGVIAVLVGGIGILTVMIMSVGERLREIAIARALGASKSQIFSIFLLEAFLLAFLGTLSGLALGYGFVIEANHLLKSQGMILFEPTPSLALFDFAAAFLLAIAGGLYPAWRGSNIRIATALRR